MMWTCAYCPKEFKYESEKRRHEQSHNPQFECSVCSKKFSFLSAVRRHEKQHERQGSVQCKQCGGNFRDDTLLRRHIQYAHKGPHTCTKCGSTLNSELALRIHMKTHKPESERRFRCSFDGCGKTFNFTHHLKHHEMTHSENKQHFCNICGKGFIQLHHLKIHLKNHDPETWLVCIAPDCNKKFTNEYARKRHLTTHKIKVDSGISSDSSANGEVCHSKFVQTSNAKDMVLCASCGECVLARLYEKHKVKCASVKVENPEDLSVSSLELSLQEISETIEKSERDSERMDKEIVLKTNMLDSKIADCTAILGGCIVTGNSETNHNCLCAQITETVDALNDFIVPNENNNNIIKLNNNFESIDISINPPHMEEMPEFEQTLDGSVKIKEMFDLEIDNSIKRQEKCFSFKSEQKREDKNEKQDLKSVLYNSCKDVLGNCIVSGNGTIDEGCLCAKMTADDQQMIAQEIEDITPCPKNTWLNERL